MHVLDVDTHFGVPNSSLFSVDFHSNAFILYIRQRHCMFSGIYVVQFMLLNSDLLTKFSSHLVNHIIYPLCLYNEIIAVRSLMGWGSYGPKLDSNCIYNHNTIAERVITVHSIGFL